MAKERFSKSTVGDALRKAIQSACVHGELDRSGGPAQLHPSPGIVYCGLDALIERAGHYGALRLAERLMHELEIGDA